MLRTQSGGMGNGCWVLVYGWTLMSLATDCGSKIYQFFWCTSVIQQIVNLKFRMSGLWEDGGILSQ